MCSLGILKQLCTTVDELKQFMQNTLLSVQSESVEIDEQMEASLESLQQLGHITISNTSQTCAGKIEVTHLGQATFKGN